MSPEERRRLIAIEERALRAGAGGHFRFRLPKAIASNRATARSRVRYDVVAIHEECVVVRPAGGIGFAVKRGQRELARAEAT